MACKGIRQARLKGKATAFAFSFLFTLLFIPISYAQIAWDYPIQDNYTITSKYGWRIHPVTEEMQFHSGIDLGASAGTNIYSSGDGTVIKVGYNDLAGNYIYINHGEGYVTKYLHILDGSIVVDEGDIVSLGDKIAEVGSTGRSTGSHLHFTVDKNGVHIDPNLILDFGDAPEGTDPDGWVMAETIGHTPGMLKLKLEGASPFEIHKSLDGENFNIIGTFEGPYYTEYGLNNGSTYWYKVIDSEGDEAIVKYTVPFTVLQVLPLKVVQLGDDYCHLEWSEFYSSVDLYMNNQLIQEGLTENSFTVTGLTPESEYSFYLINRAGEKSNTVKIVTPNELSNMINRLDEILKKLFIPNNNIDTDGDGVPDPYDKLIEEWEEMKNYRPITVGEDTKSAIEEINNSFDSSDDELPKLEVDFGMGQVEGLTFNVFDLSEFQEEIQAIRMLLTAILFVSLFIFFVQALVPKLKI